MVRTRKVVDRNWPSWRYGPNGESAIFESEDQVPDGWTKKPGEPYIPPEVTTHNHDDLVTELQSRGFIVSGVWSDAYMKELLDGSSPAR